MDGPLSHASYAVISEDNTHDVDVIYKVKELATDDITTILPNIEKIYLFTVGCVGQYKN